MQDCWIRNTVGVWGVWCLKKAWFGLWGKTCCSVIDGKLQLKHASAAKKGTWTRIKNIKSSDQHRHRESGNQDKPHWQIAMQLRYRFSHWIGRWVVSALVVTFEELDCPWFQHVFNSTIVVSSGFEFNVWRNKCWKWFTVSGRSKLTYTHTNAMKSR